MATARPFSVAAWLSVAVLFGLSALIFQRGGDWLVTHDSTYYWLSDHGFRWVTNWAETFFFFGPVVSACGGLFFGLLVVAGVEWYRAYRRAGL